MLNSSIIFENAKGPLLELSTYLEENLGSLEENRDALLLAYGQIVDELRFQIRAHEDDLYLLLGIIATSVIALPFVWLFRRLYKRFQRLRPKKPTDENNRERVESEIFQSTKEEPEAKDRFFPMSPKLCKKAGIKIPKGMMIKSSRVWDITVVNKRRIPGLPSTVTLFKEKQKNTRIALEIIGPAKQENVDLSTNKKRRFVVSLNNLDGDGEHAEDPRLDGEYLADDEHLNVRIYRLRRETKRSTNIFWMGGKTNGGDPLSDLSGRSGPTAGGRKRGKRRWNEHISDASIRSIDSQCTSTDLPQSQSGEQSDDDSFYEGTEESILFPPNMMKEWVSHKQYLGHECDALNSHDNVIEARLGSGLTSIVRDLVFDSTEEQESFRSLCRKMAELVEKRARRQLNLYRHRLEERDASHSPASEALQPSPRQQHEQGTESIRLLIEIVSATNLPGRFSMDPYVVVHLGDKLIHRTSVLVATKNPIWTIKTGSLCLLCVSPEDLIEHGSWRAMKFSLLDFNSLAKDEIIGTVYFTVKELLESEGERKGYGVNLVEDSDSSSNEARLFLRIREATTDDVEFMKDLEKNFGKDGVYSGETLLPMRPPQSTLLKFQYKHGEESELLHRVRPFPDPEREEETKWLSSDDLYKESMLSSVNWTEVGSGDLGYLFVEILGCSDLPNMDRAILGRKTDAFASLVFEDSAVTTDVIGQCLNPRWMPWSRRAFVFNVENPNSDLFIGIFDHDPEPPIDILAPSVVHDPIGRIEVQLSSFDANTVYTLAYPLYFGDEIEEHDKKEKGKVWIRVRKKWNDYKKAMLASTRPAPITVVSMVRPIDYTVVRYTTVGPRDDTGFNIWKFTEYIAELQDYGYLLEHLHDFAFNTWLWRGHYPMKIFGKKYLVPLHSLTAFFWGVTVSHDLNKLPSFLLFCIGWVLLVCNEDINRNPSPWHKCPSYKPHLTSLLLGKTPASAAVAPYQQLRAIKNFEAARQKRDKWREKERELLSEQERHMQMVLQTENADQYNSVLDITTGNKSDTLLMRFLFPLKPVLYPIQKWLRQIVIWCRIGTSVMLWEESHLAFWVTTASFVGSVVTYKIPFAYLLEWSLKISAWVFLGPWMLLVDRWFFKYAQEDDITDKERDEKIRTLMREQYEEFMDEALNYQIRKEDIIKEESMKSYLFGPHHIRVPRFRETRFKSSPLPESFAAPYEHENEEPTVIADRKYGQKLSGNMIPKMEFQTFSARGDLEAEKPMISLLSDQLLSLIPTRWLPELAVLPRNVIKSGDAFIRSQAAAVSVQQRLAQERIANLEPQLPRIPSGIKPRLSEAKDRLGDAKSDAKHRISDAKQRMHGSRASF